MLIDCADAQTGLCLLCSQTPEYRFSRVHCKGPDITNKSVNRFIVQISLL